MIIRDNLDFDEFGHFDLLLTVKKEALPINTGVFAIRKSHEGEVILSRWRSLTYDICKSDALVRDSVQSSGGPDQHAILGLIRGVGDAFTYRRVPIEGSTALIAFAPCEIYNQTNPVFETSEAKILHYKGTWHKVFLEGKGIIKGDLKKYIYMYNLWKRMLREEEQEAGVQFLPMQCRLNVWFNETIRKKTRTAKNI